MPIVQNMPFANSFFSAVLADIAETFCTAIARCGGQLMNFLDSFYLFSISRGTLSIYFENVHKTPPWLTLAGLETI